MIIIILSMSFLKVKTVNQLWSWLELNVPGDLKYGKNKHGMYLLADEQSYLIESPMLRQLRVDPKSKILQFFV